MPLIKVGLGVTPGFGVGFKVGSQPGSTPLDCAAGNVRLIVLEDLMGPGGELSLMVTEVPGAQLYAIHCASKGVRRTQPAEARLPKIAQVSRLSELAAGLRYKMEWNR